jgi:hypothetical protein
MTDAYMRDMYARMLKPAADFLVDGGVVDIDWNQNEIRPPFTQQERWEEQQGYSPSTTASVVAGLTVAAEMARAAGSGPSSPASAATTSWPARWRPGRRTPPPLKAFAAPMSAGWSASPTPACCCLNRSGMA